MKYRQLFAGLVVALAVVAVGSSRAVAKDLFLYMGYEVVQLIDGDTDAVIADIPVDGAVRQTAFTADKKFIYVSTDRHRIHKIDIAARKVVAVCDLFQEGWDRFHYGFALSADEKSAFVNLYQRKTADGDVVIKPPVLAEIDLANGKILREMEMPWGVAQILAVKNASVMYVFGKDLIKVDVSGKTMKQVGTYEMYSKKWNMLPFWDYSFENGGTFYGNYYTPEIMGLLKIDQASGEIEDVPLDGIPVFAYSVIPSVDGKRAFAVMDELNVIDLESRTYSAMVPIHQGTKYGINISSDGKKVYAAGGGSTINIYDTQTLALQKVLQMASDGMDLRRVTY